MIVTIKEGERSLCFYVSDLGPRQLAYLGILIQDIIEDGCYTGHTAAMLSLAGDLRKWAEERNRQLGGRPADIFMRRRHSAVCGASRGLDDALADIRNRHGNSEDGP